jgi:glycosyltransferase involved in cell wall biosynthesis
MKSVPSSPLVSVAMSMRNSASTVREAVRSVQLQTLSNWELIVIDNGSSDQSSAIVQEFSDHRIRLVREDRSIGLAPRLNQAVDLARGEFIARMDADDICFPNRLEQQVARLRQNPGVDLLGCGAVVFTSNGELVGELPVGPTHQDIVAEPFLGFPLPHPTWCGRAMWFKSNPYDARLEYAEDQDLLLRCFRHSKFAAVETVLLAYRQDRLSLKKLLPGRVTFVKSLLRYGAGSGHRLAAVTGIAAQIVKGTMDLATVGLGLNRTMQLRRLNPVSSSIANEWQALRHDLMRPCGSSEDVR